jgi:hypothetical protein
MLKIGDILERVGCPEEVVIVTNIKRNTQGTVEYLCNLYKDYKTWKAGYAWLNYWDEQYIKDNCFEKINKVRKNYHPDWL